MSPEKNPRSWREGMLTLLEALPPSERMIPVLAAIRSRLMQEPDDNSLHKYLLEIAQAMTDARSAAEDDRQERAQNLVRLRERLKQLDAQYVTPPAGITSELTASLRSAWQELSDCASVMHSELSLHEMQNLLDPLTGIANRLAFEQRLRLEYARWKRYASPLVVQWWGIDAFADIRQKHGRTAADLALMRVARLMTGNLRETDFVARYEQEQFAVLLPETLLDNSHTVSERLRQKVNTTQFTHRGVLVPVSLSCGYATLEEGDTVPGLLLRVREAFMHACTTGPGSYRAG